MNNTHEDNLDNLPYSEDDITFTSQDVENGNAILEPTEEIIIRDPAVEAEIEEIRLRALAEMENFKRRLQKEKEEQALYATEKVLADLLPTLDNFDLALQYGSKSEECQNLVVGVEMTRKLLLDTLKNHGLVALGAVGEEFDPNLHEALGQEARADIGPGRIAQVMQRGYKLRERLLRPAKVMVTPGEAKKVNVKV